MSDNFDMTNSCLYKYVSNSSWSWIVKEWIWNLWTKWLSLYTSVNWYKTQDFKYRFFAYIPFKFKFDYKAIFHNVWSTWRIKFYIDDVEFATFNKNTANITNFKTFETQLLRPWIKEMKWTIWWWYYWDTELFLDNLQFWCANWESNCWWTDYTLDLWDELPWDIYSFWWDAGWLTWDQTTDRSEWTHAIISPDFINRYSSNYITKNIKFSTPKKLSFSYKGLIPSDWYVEFYIDWVRYLYADNATPW
jgi:hypothetical protein